LAYYSRLLHRLDDAEQAITECLFLKDEKKAAPPDSLAISIGEYAQLLFAQGRYREAEAKNSQAIALLDQTLHSGDASSVRGDKGMLLVERAHIYEAQGRLGEARQLLDEALLILNDERA